MNALRVATLRAAAVAGIALVTAVVSSFAVGRLIAARPGEWAIPLRIGVAGYAMRVDASVASLSRWATGPLGTALLDGRSVVTRVGVLHFARVDRDRLAIECAPCRLQSAALGDAPLQVAALRVTASRIDDRVSGTIIAGEVHGHFAGRFGADGLQLAIALDRAPIAAYYRSLAASVPEARIATIDGTAAFAIRVALPSGALSIAPSVDGWSVSGLGTERLAGPMPRVACNAAAASRSPTDPGPWLPRAVIAAEDQRFLEHPGYDLDEVAASLVRNQSDARVARGGSTIPQQLAKLLFTGSDRSAGRKLRELLYAVEMERTLGKARMLRLYLAIAPWGDGQCGADAAARHWFGRAPARLTAAQAVWLASMLHAPDREAARWTASSGIDLSRATWVAKGMARVGPAARARIVAELAAMAPGGAAAPVVASR